MRHEHGDGGDQWTERSAPLVGSGDRMRTTKAKIVFSQAVSTLLRDSKSQDESYDRVVGQSVSGKKLNILLGTLLYCTARRAR